MGKPRFIRLSQSNPLCRHSATFIDGSIADSFRSDIRLVSSRIITELRMHPAQLTVADLLKLGSDHWRAGQIGEAQVSFRRALQFEPANPLIAYYLGILAHQSGDYEEAIRWFGFAVALGQRDPALFNNFGEAYRALGRLAEACQCYREGLALAPTMPQLHNNIGLVHFAWGQLPEAADHFAEALRLQPDYAKAHRNYGRVLQDMGRSSEASGHFERAQARIRWPENTTAD